MVFQYQCYSSLIIYNRWVPAILLTVLLHGHPTYERTVHFTKLNTWSYEMHTRSCDMHLKKPLQLTTNRKSKKKNCCISEEYKHGNYAFSWSPVSVYSKLKLFPCVRRTKLFWIVNEWHSNFFFLNMLTTIFNSRILIHFRNSHTFPQFYCAAS